MSSFAKYTELRRCLPLIGAGLLLLALALPMWRITLGAPQYPGETLVVELYAYPRLGGDFLEVNALNKYVGFHYPDPVFVDPNFPVHEHSVKTPEWLLGPVVFVGLAAMSVFVAIAPTTRKLKRGLTGLVLGTVATLVATFVIIQYRLYQAGHSLDPNAPLSGIDAFTPPVVGGYAVANISGFAWVGPGGYLTMTAVVLLFVAYHLRDSDVTVRALPLRTKQIAGKLNDRILRLGSWRRRLTGTLEGTETNENMEAESRSSRGVEEIRARHWENRP